MANKPKYLDWITSNDPVKISEPIDAKKSNGFVYKERPPFQYLNWLFNLIDKWFGYIGSEIDQFSVESEEPASMSITVRGGRKWDGSTYTTKTDLTLGPITAPTTNPRIDRVVLNRSTLVASIVTGAESATPVAPTIPANSLPLAQISLLTTTTAIDQTMITPETSMYHEVNATTGAPGTVELATNAETQTGTDAARVVTPAGLQSKVASTSAKGIAELATGSETLAGTDASRVVTPAGLLFARKPNTVDHGSKSANYTLDMSDGELHTVEFTANAILTISSSYTIDKATIAVKTNGNTITVSGVDNNPVTLTASANVQDIVGFVKSFGKITTVGLMDNVSAV